MQVTLGSSIFSDSLNPEKKKKKTPGNSPGSDVKESACSAKDLGLTPGLGRSAGEGNGTPLQYSCLENPMDKEHVKLATKTHTH